MISTCWLSLRGPTTWISRRTAKVSYDISITPTTICTCHFPTTLPAFSVISNLLDFLFIYNSLFPPVQLRFTCGLFPLSVCITQGTLNCAQKSSLIVKPWNICSWFLLLFFFSVECSLEADWWAESYQFESLGSQLWLLLNITSCLGLPGCVYVAGFA